MKLFLVRHAEGENYKTHWQLPTTPLSEHGVKQAEALAAINRFLNTTKTYSSHITRARQTADIIGKEVEVRNDIYERTQSSGIYGLSRTDPLAMEYISDITKSTLDWDYKWDAEEESKNEVRARAIGFKNFLEENHAADSVLVVSHENFLKHFISTCILGAGEVTKELDKLYRSINIENTGVSLLIFSPETKSWKIWYINDYGHLGVLIQ